MVRVLGLFDKLPGVADFNEAATGNGAEDGTVDKSKVALESPNGVGSGAVAIEPDMSNERMPNGLTSASGCHDSKEFNGGARPGGSNGYGHLVTQDGD